VLGYPVPVWWRFLLFCQVPLALGTALVLAELSAGATRRVVAATFAFALVFKLATLTLLSDRITYFGTRVQDSYRVGRIVPRGPGLVASDPFTSYFVPGASGHRVLVVTKAHVGSQRELLAAEDGYRLLHRFYAGPDWPAAGREMWRRGVRYVVVEKSTSLAPATLERFSTGPTPLIRTRADRRRLGAYYYRLNRVGRIVYDRRPIGKTLPRAGRIRLRPYAVYVLDRRKLFA
jgi:hypothetical protein